MSCLGRSFTSKCILKKKTVVQNKDFIYVLSRWKQCADPALVKACMRPVHRARAPSQGSGRAHPTPTPLPSFTTLLNLLNQIVSSESDVWIGLPRSRIEPNLKTFLGSRCEMNHPRFNSTWIRSNSVNIFRPCDILSRTALFLISIVSLNRNALNHRIEFVFSL